MAIKASSSQQIAALVADLSGDSIVKRETAIARLTVIGPRAVERVAALATSAASSDARVAALRTLEALDDPRALDPALEALDDRDAAVAAAAASVARTFVRGKRGAHAVDRLTAAALDVRRPEAARLASLRALLDLERATVAPILEALAGDPSDAVRAAAGENAADSNAPEPADLLARAADEDLPESPDAVRRALAQAGGTAPPERLRRLIERVREREGGVSAEQRAAWTTARAAAHVALAVRHSRIALYDLRESLETAKAPLPVEFLKAVALVGDASCLEAIASAHAAAGDGWWRQHLTDAFYAIIDRERLTARSPALKKIRKKPTRPTRPT